MPAKSNAFSTCSASRVPAPDARTPAARRTTARSACPFSSRRASDAAARDGAERGADAFGAAMRRAHVIGSERHAGSGSTGRSRARRREAAPVPERLPRSPIASAAGTTAQPGCALVTGSKSSVSSACANMPLASAALIGRRPDVGRQDRRFRHAALRAHEPDRHLARLEPRARDHRAERVEDAVLGLAHDIRRAASASRAATM